MESSSTSISSSSCASYFSHLKTVMPKCPRPQRLFYFDFDDEVGGDFELEPRHFLDSCSFCGKRLARNRDIFMYRGDTPFCSEECRQEQIAIDEAREKSWRSSLKAAGARKARRNIHVRPDTVVAV
ncbi:hypothetical protein Cni_G14849 [Canna indica]|uniref:FLZ-type domain-containing protein n=1 Tax=Canna indica TaxID=4628 RepID=A0AAQ3KCT1_9LILI|nr:hypothetical protein Cni_G14849 [Canna indica]